MGQKLARSFYIRSTLTVARDLLGRTICYDSPIGSLAARIVEVEAYIGRDDPACHAAPGPTARNRVMFGPGGFSYVYLIYGMHHCFNIVTEKEGSPAAILVRAAEPVNGTEIMLRNSPSRRVEHMLRGPGKLCRAFGLTRDQNGLDLTRSELYISTAKTTNGKVICTERIGIRKGVELQYRFYLSGSGAVSGPVALRKG